MPMKRANRKSRTGKVHLFDVILAKYRTDPEGFFAYLPDVAKALDSISPSHYSSHSPFGLTENERAHRLQALGNILENIKKREITREEATRALEHCAILIKDDSLPQEISYKTLLRLLRFALGRPISAIKGGAVIAIQQDRPDKVVHHISLIRGIVLDLSNDMRLLSITLNPQKAKERRRAMRFISLVEDGFFGLQQHSDSYTKRGHHATS
ncbi:MAG: hypothetical protein FVQ80_15115 [Planctomycetes bacterium]|nr:hypothetical protein [Planctomycetota bacterium]